MKKGLFILAVLVLGGSAVAFGMTDLYVSGKWRYRMTVTVETPEGIKTGSAVREVSNSRSAIRLDLPESTNPADVKGEAVVVDLGERGVPFALVSDTSDDEFYQAFPVPGGGPTTTNGIKYYNSLKPGKKATLDPARYPGYPQLVMFKDMDDPKTVTPVMEWERFDGQFPVIYRLKQDHFEELFGKGVKLKEITLETTDDPVTWNIEKYLRERHTVGPYEFAKGTDFWEWRRGLKFDDPRKISGANFRRGRN